MSVEEVCLRKIVKDSVNRTVRMEGAFYDNIYGSSEGFEEEVLNNFEKMTSFDVVKDKTVCYPIKDGKRSSDDVDKGYEWFEQNHRGYIRENHKEVKMPNSRKQMYYKEYMKAMEPELGETLKIEAPRGMP